MILIAPATRLIIEHIRRREQLPEQAIIPMVVAGELEAFALKADWGFQKVTFLQYILDYYPLVEVSRSVITLYAQVDAYSQVIVLLSVETTASESAHENG